MNEEHLCPVCGGATSFLGIQQSKADESKFRFRQCQGCYFSYVENYRTDLQDIYNEQYYKGKGLDPLVDYVDEFGNPSKTIRGYEWKGIYSIYKDLCPSGGKWLDFGCGVGGMVQFARANGVDIVGVEEGWAADFGRSFGLPILRQGELEQWAGKFDFISAIEVFEHIPRPVDVFIQLRKLLKPGGILFLTTGNARPWRDKLLSWEYAKHPDLHSSFYEPGTLRQAMKMAGFQPGVLKWSGGLEDIIKFKVLKNLRIKQRSAFIDAFPWGAITRIVDAQHQVSSQPYGVAIEGA